jgi:hypothetical protein
MQCVECGSSAVSERPERAIYAATASSVNHTVTLQR